MNFHKEVTRNVDGELMDIYTIGPDVTPVPGGEPEIEDLVIRDLQKRIKVSIDGISQKSSIDALVETYQGAITLVLSLRKAIYIKTGR